ncbi:tmem1 family [Ophiostoma piceae UAMH 11346]|uniref:Tmem1 family n=1 Tax=Ophiostoma piceae (strain UAMH 11346) TaxID=1262450 RepID=S3BXG4_OPHP1|nr:tmem1 family [Ophiostoma piceae UAMH 11346]
MEQPFSTSKVTVEYFDPHGLYKLLGPGLVSRLPLRHLHWQSHSGPLRSIETLHVELVSASSNPSTTPSALLKRNSNTPSISTPDDGFQTAIVTGRQGSVDTNRSTSTTTKQTSAAATTSSPAAGPRRHQIPGLRRTPYLKLLLVRCDDNDTYKAQTRSEIKDWVKHNTGAKKSAAVAENHDAFEWMIVHVVLPNSAAYAQPRTSKAGTDGSTPDLTKTSRWGKSSSTIFERLRSDFNTTSVINAPSSKTPVDRVAQIRIGLEDVPYEMLPRAAAPAPTATPGGHAETERETQNAWLDLVDKFKTLILASFDVRVSQYEDDIREKDVQRSLPGWNFCTFFILKEGLARGFESVGLVEDSLVGYDELSVGLDTVIKEQQGIGNSPATHGGSLLSFTGDLKAAALRAINSSMSGSDDDDEDTVDLQASAKPFAAVANDEIPISSIKKPYRDLILANNVSVFDFRCYIFARQISLLLRLGNAWSSREELLAKLKEQQDAAMPSPTSSVAPSSYLTVPAPSVSGDDAENLSMLAEICRRTLEFVPAVSQVMREDLLFALAPDEDGKENEKARLDANALRVIDNMVSSFAFSIAQQILAQTSTRSLPIPPSSLLPTDPHAPEPKASIPEPKTMMHPARTSSLGHPAVRGPPPLSPGIFPGAQGATVTEAEKSKFLKAGLEDLAARRADLYMLSRSILQKGGQLQGWTDGWSSVPIINEPSDDEGMEDVSLDDDEHDNQDKPKGGDGSAKENAIRVAPTAGIENLLLRTALESTTGFYRLYEVLTDKCLRHFTVAGHPYAVNASLADLAVLKFFLGEHAAAAAYFYETTVFFGANSWSLLELSMLHMYATSLKALGRTDEYAWCLLKFLTRAAAAEGDAKRVSAQGCLVDLLEASTNISAEMRVPLTNFFGLVKLDGPPAYHDGQDSFSVTVRLVSLLVDTLPADSVRVRMVQKQQSQTTALGPPREIWLETRGATPLKPGKSTAQLFCNTIVTGVYEIDQVRIKSRNLVLFHDREVAQAKTAKAHTTAMAAAAVANSSPKIFADPHVVLHQRTEGLDMNLSTCRDLQLDKNNFLELSLLSGWNDVKSCEIKIRAATGGLRLTTSESKIVSSSGGEARAFAKPVGAGIVCFDDIGAGESVTISFPFSIEQDALELCLKIEVTYTTEDGTFVFAKQPTISTALALGVNVQDVFKHNALFSRFTVSTATASPLQVYKSELLDSEYFTSEYGSDDNNKPLPFVYPKQPISLLYKIVRKAGAISVGHKTSDPRKTTMYIKLHYSVFQDQLDAALASSLAAAFAQESNVSVAPFSKVASAAVLRHVHAALTPYDLERTALLGELATGPVLGHVNWIKEFPGLGGSTAEQLAGVMNGWLGKNAVLALPNLEWKDAADLMRTILIPVDIPSITIVHTADIQLQPSATAVAIEAFEEEKEQDEAEAEAVNDDSGADDNDNDSAISVSVPIFCVNQLLPATLQLQWTRVWDTLDDAQEPGNSTKKAATRAKRYSDIEFAFEVSAPMDAWLIGGRRKGHFVIPAPNEDAVGLSSTADSEATIPLVLIPLREGRLPYPSVEIREVQPHEQGQEPSQQRDDEFVQQHHETDYRNLGETVAVVADRKRVTLSLDASGPGGGPLVLESERAQLPGRELV